jgi:tetratricopeptide (TPR) repeat protein
MSSELNSLQIAYDLLARKDIEAALKIFERQIEIGDKDAVYYVGHIYSGNYDGYFDFARAEKYLIKSLDYGVEISKKELGYLYFRNKNYDNSYIYLKKESEIGDVEASYWAYVSAIRSHSFESESSDALKKSYELNNPYSVRLYAIDMIKNGCTFQKIKYFGVLLKSIYLFLNFRSTLKNIS